MQPALSLLSLNEDMLTKDICGTAISGGSRALQALVNILNSFLGLKCMKYLFSKENPAFIYIADRVLSKLCNCVVLDQMSYKESLKRKNDDGYIDARSVKCEPIGMGYGMEPLMLDVEDLVMMWKQLLSLLMLSPCQVNQKKKKAMVPLQCVKLN